MTTQNTAAAHESSNGKAVEVFINARPHMISAKSVSFEEVVALAFPGGAQGGDTEYIVTYTRGQHGNGTGNLAPGGEVRIKKVTSFSIHFTTRS